MMDLIIPKNLNFSIDPAWEILEQKLPQGYRHIASVERQGGEMYDLGQNAEGNFLLFRRLTDPFSQYSHGKGEVLSPTDLAGFGLLPGCSQDMIGLAEEEGEYSSLCKTQLVRSK